MSLEPEPDDEVGSEGSGGHLDEIDLIEYEQDPWNDADDFLYQQQQRVGACKAHGFLLAGKPGAGKTHLAGKLAAELGAVHVGLPQILAQCVEAYVVKQEYEGLQAKIDAEKNKAPPEPAAPSTEEGAYNDEGGEAAAAEDGAEQPPGPDEEQIEKWSEEQKTVLKRWSTLHLPKRQFEAAPEFCEAAALLMAGKAVEGDLLGRLLTARLRAEDVQFRGYVLESLPPPLLPDLLLQPGLPKLDYVLMLELTDKEALDRLERCPCDRAACALALHTHTRRLRAGAARTRSTTGADAYHARTRARTHALTHVHTNTHAPSHTHTQPAAGAREQHAVFLGRSHAGRAPAAGAKGGCRRQSCDGRGGPARDGARDPRGDEVGEAEQRHARQRDHAHGAVRQDR